MSSKDRWSTVSHAGACVLLLGLTLIAGCERKSPAAATASVAASNSYLEAAVRDLLGESTPVVRLAEPGMCPGHFDMRPSQIDALRECRLLLRFDFQKTLDAKLGDLCAAGLSIEPIAAPGGLGEPDTYQTVCQHVADALVRTALVERAQADDRLAAISTRLKHADAAARDAITEARLDGQPVVTSKHQQAALEFLGFNVVATFTAADTARIGEIDAAIRSGNGARLIVANEPEGRQLADALAERIGAPVVVLANFPDSEHHHVSFDEMLRDNVRRLTGAAQP
ncbi:MAG: zinc ABC transporter substrate-binding protein [Phycisphaerae bacterium]|nr:zinc ABC transporter substrate-binding protein [Phycisphaerae bacterium]